MKSLLCAWAGLALTAGVVAAAPEVPAPVLSKPEPAAAVTNPTPATASATTTNKFAEPRRLTDPVPAGGKSAVDAELARMTAELDALHREETGADDISISGRMLLPADDYWSEAVGGEIQWRHWVTELVGFAVAGGMQSWTLKDAQYIIDPSHETHPTVTGSVSIIPLGASLLLRRPVSKDAFRLTAELGLRYLAVSGDATMAYSYQNMFDQHTYLETDIEFESRMVGVASIELGGTVCRHAEWFVVGGYQLDMAGGDNWLFEEIANDFSAAVVGAGLRWIP
jgi:hypothetical protein